MKEFILYAGVVVMLGIPIGALVLAVYDMLPNSRWCRHEWHSPAFRVRVCDKCGRREVLMREWEFDGYDKA